MDGLVTGLFTDLRRPTQVNADYNACVLKFTGSTGSARDMWITMVNPPPGGVAPIGSCLIMETSVVIHRFDNRKAAGLVSNYDPDLETGLFFGLYDNANADAFTISKFDGATGKLMDTVATFPLGSKIEESLTYSIYLEVCNSAGYLSVAGDVHDPDNEIAVLVFQTPEGTLLPTDISPSGQIGIAGYAKSSFVNSTVLGYRWTVLTPP